MKTINQKSLLITILLLAVANIFSCKKEESEKNNPVSSSLNLPATPFDYASLNLPSHFTTNIQLGPNATSVQGIDNMPANNPITNHGATLGRVLFYDKNLSANGTIACASCHQQDKGFSDNAILSAGFKGGLTGRHSMSLINARFYQRGRFFWDERAASLEEQVLKPFQDSIEMGMTLDQVVNKVKEKSYYTPLFQNAFGSNEVNAEKISKALAQFVRSMVSYSSKYDIGRASAQSPDANFSNFSAEENLGKEIFFRPIAQGGGSCFGCHTTEAFINSNQGPENNGLDLTSTNDLGVGGALNNPALNGNFKTTSLRNIELTAPYMHDGRFATLDEVIEHYNSGIKAHPNLSPKLRVQNGVPAKLNLTPSQKTALVAFLKTLTDNSVSTNVKWSNPFNKN